MENESSSAPVRDELAQQLHRGAAGERTVSAALAALCRKAAAEGAVLLKNENGALPLKKDVPTAVFGRVQYDYFYVGYGSGGDVNSPYCIGLTEGLRGAGAAVDETLADRYKLWCAEHPIPQADWGGWPRSLPEMPLSDDEILAAAGRCSTAVVVIGRSAGESQDSTEEKGSYYLTDDELDLLRRVSAAFERTVVAVNSGSVIDMSWTEELSCIDAVVFLWQSGMESGRAAADILTGDAVPCGKLTDTVARRYEDYPSSGHFLGRDCNEYTEDIYVGYRYFETFAPRGVLFPFGFGLSYTSFSLTGTAVRASGGDILIETTVTNTGRAAGKEVVQAYCSAPQGALGKASRSLAAFAKTELLAPGQSQRVELRFSLDSQASYDDSGASGHRSCFVLEAGEYKIYVGTDVRSAAQCGAATLDALRVVRRAEEVCPPSPAHPFRRMTHGLDADGRSVPVLEPVPTASRPLRERILERLPRLLPPPEHNVTFRDVAERRASVEEFAAQLTDEELVTLTRGDVTMDSPLGAKGNAGTLGGVSESLRARGVPPVITTDGPSGIRLQSYASLLPCGTALASSWNEPLVQELYAALSCEMLEKGSDILLAPGMNIHRNPLCGRNFEYYSEDPLLTGRIAAAAVRGIQSHGGAACPKHFACNNQETNRNRCDSRLSERALREIYLRGFEICVREAEPLTIMTSYNLINGVWSHYNYDLCTTVLRGEWGFRGCAITDWWMQPCDDPDFPALSDNAYRVRAQVDVLMPGSGPKTDGADSSALQSLRCSDGLTRAELQRSACSVLRLALQIDVMRRRAEKNPAQDSL